MSDLLNLLVMAGLTFLVVILFSDTTRGIPNRSSHRVWTAGEVESFFHVPSGTPMRRRGRGLTAWTGRRSPDLT